MKFFKWRYLFIVAAFIIVVTNKKWQEQALKIVSTKKGKYLVGAAISGFLIFEIVGYLVARSKRNGLQVEYNEDNINQEFNYKLFATSLAKHLKSFSYSYELTVERDMILEQYFEMNDDEFKLVYNIYLKQENSGINTLKDDILSNFMPFTFIDEKVVSRMNSLQLL